MKNFQINNGSYSNDICNYPPVAFSPQLFTDILQLFSQMISSYYWPEKTVPPYRNNQSFDRMNYDSN